MEKIYYCLALVGVLLLGSCQNNDVLYNELPPARFTDLVWSDEFDSTALDTTRWNRGVGFYFNETGEQQYFTNRPENIFVRDGNLVIRANKETYQGQPYTSGDLSTKGKFFFKDNYRIDIRVKMSKGAGLWNSFAFLPEELKYGPYPKSGAITLEYLGKQPSNAIFNVSYASSTNQMRTSVMTLEKNASFADDYHTFTAIWGNGIVRWFHDNREVMRVTQSDLQNATYPFNENFFLTIKTAVGGATAGTVDAATAFPQELLIDYVKVYKAPLPDEKQ
jgi:beta-glucanase (GH16 family)